MKKSKKNLMAIALASVIGVSSLTGCNAVETEENQTESIEMEEVSNEEEVLVEEEQNFENKVFEPYTHVYYVRTYNPSEPSTIKGGQVEIPEGYEILDIENWTQKHGYGSRNAGYDIWFINNKTVEVSPVYNETIGTYDYSQPGTVIEMTNEEDGPTKTLIP